MNQHQIKVVPVNGLVLGPCRRAICKTCGWMGPMRSKQNFGAQADLMATRDGEKHVKNIVSAGEPDFMVRLNEECPILVEEPAWKK